MSDKLEHVLSFVVGALEDAESDDGLDGGSGESVVCMIDDFLSAQIPSGRALLQSRSAIQQAIYDEDGWDGDDALVKTLKSLTPPVEPKENEG